MLGAAESADHPRSRGVYPGTSRLRSSQRGSSPLARGLRNRNCDGRRHRRIIPARAGFTEWLAPRSRPAPDHPRSRGVYPDYSSPGTHGRGSSPLARGLQGGRARPPPPHRIIPARAGFTIGRRRACRPPRDHPRSRGVYSRRNDSGPNWRGSSPLARGLPGIMPGPPMVGGIIPARAGFT